MYIKGITYIVQMAIIIAGARHFTEFEMLKEYCYVTLSKPDLKIILGGARELVLGKS